MNNLDLINSWESEYLSEYYFRLGYNEINSI